MSNPSDAAPQAPFDLSWLQLSKIQPWKLGLLAGGFIAGLAVLGYLSSSSDESQSQQQQQRRRVSPKSTSEFDEDLMEQAKAHARKNAQSRKRNLNRSPPTNEDLEAKLREMMQLVEPLNRDKKYAEVERIYREMVELIEEDQPNSHLLGFVEEGLADTLAKSGQNAEAEKHYVKSISIWEEHELYEQKFEVQLALIQLISKAYTRLEEAAEYIDLFKKDPNFPPQLRPRYDIEMANVKAFQNNFGEAEALFIQLIRMISDALAPNDPNVTILEINLASLKIYQRKFDEGSALFAKAQEVFSGHADLLRYTLEQAARVNWEMEHYAASEEYFSKLFKQCKPLPDHDTARIYADFANFYWHVDHAKKGEVLFDQLRNLENPPKVTSRTIITTRATIAVAEKPEDKGFYYDIHLKLRIIRSEGVRNKYIIPQGAILEIKYENLEREGGPESEEPEYITEEREVSQENTQAGEVQITSPVFKSMNGLSSEKKNFEVVVSIWKNAAKEDLIGVHHQLASIKGIPK